MAITTRLLLLCSSALALPSLPQCAECQLGKIDSFPSAPASRPAMATINTHENGLHSKRWLATTETVRGVNLGSQFIIEPWMTADEFKAMDCEGLQDETSCVNKLGQEAADAVFANHWNTWTTQDDITKIVGLGLNVIRIPVGFWIKEDLVQPWEHFPRGGLPYLDRLVGWAADVGLQVIIDLHAAPGSQAIDQQFTGYKTKDPQFYSQYNYERAVQFLEWMANRIHTKQEYRTTGVLEVLNEPLRLWESAEKAADMVQNFYPEAYRRIRAAEEQLGIGYDQQLKIQYMGKNWGSGDPTAHLPDSFSNVIFDDHRYYVYGDNTPKTGDGALDAACENNDGGMLDIVGEWSLALQDSAVDPVTDKEWYKLFWNAQVQSYERAGGWIFWVWRCNWIGGKDEWRWSYESAVDNGIIPSDVSTNAIDGQNPCSG